MVLGGNEELIYLNEETLWSGAPANLNPNLEAPKYLAQKEKRCSGKIVRRQKSFVRRVEIPAESYTWLVIE